jgi:hypothetical protein
MKTSFTKEPPSEQQKVSDVVSKKYQELTQFMNRKARRSKNGKKQLMYAQHAAITAGVQYLKDLHKDDGVQEGKDNGSVAS